MDRNFPKELIDKHGRTVRYLRISVTDRCNLCCMYCRDEKKPFVPHENILHYEEILHFIGIAYEFGVRKFRFTGGEPFSRKDFLSFLEKVHEKHPDASIKLTTNGTMLYPVLDVLKELGVSINLSLDTLDRQRFAKITGRDALADVLKSMEGIIEKGIPLKINAVAMRGVNDGETKNLVKLCFDYPLDFRFIEFMPMGEDSIWSPQLFWPAKDILASVDTWWQRIPNVYDKNRSMKRLSEELGPAKLWKLVDDQGNISKGSFGLISSVTQSFCASCNRLRLTAEGNIRTCLYDDREYSVRNALRCSDDDEIRRILVAAVAQKPIGAEILAKASGSVARKRMSAIGG